MLIVTHGDGATAPSLRLQGHKESYPINVERMAPIDEYMDNALADYVWVATMDTLKERECLVVNLRCGLSDGEGHTLQQVGACIGVSRERVRQILARLRLRPTRHDAKT